jgi:serine protease Do
MRTKLLLLATLLFSTLFHTQISYAEANILASNGQVPATISPMLEKVMPAVVNIYAEGERNSAVDPFGQNRFRQQRGQNPQDRHFTSIGSGVIVDAQKGYILTNAHVVFEANNITITLNDGRRFKAKPLGLDVGFDLALLSITPDNITDIPTGQSNQVKVGDFVTAIGSPFNLPQTVTTGVVSALHRSINPDSNEDFIQTDASINVGSSGGALVDSQGRLVGINTAILAPGGGNIGIGFAIPIDLAKQVMQQILQHGKIQRGMLGVLVQDLTPGLAKSFQAPVTHGALVSQVIPNSPADKAGVEAGDIVTKINNIELKNSNILRNTINLSRPNTNITLNIIRDGKPLTKKVTLSSGEGYASTLFENAGELLSGVSLQNFDQINMRFGHVKGVQVIDISRDSDAWSAQLRPGDVIISANKKAVSDLESLKKIMSESKQNQLRLRVMRESGAFYIIVP